MKVSRCGSAAFGAAAVVEFGCFIRRIHGWRVMLFSASSQCMVAMDISGQQSCKS